MFRKSALASLLLVAIFAGNALAAGKTVSISASAYSPASVTVAMGGSVAWKNTTAKKQNVTPDASFLGTMFWPSATIAKHKTSKAVTFPDAGTFTYHDSLHPLNGTVVVPMTADSAYITLNSVVMLTLGTVATNTGGQPVAHYVQASLNGGAWATIATTPSNQFSWKPSAQGTWQVKTYLHALLSGANSGASPTITVTVE